MKTNRKYETSSTPSGLIFAFGDTPAGCTGGYSHFALSGQNSPEIIYQHQIYSAKKPVLKGLNMNNRG
jgi:hypothetical protein